MLFSEKTLLLNFTLVKFEWLFLSRICQIRPCFVMYMGWFLIVTISGDHYWHFVIGSRDATCSAMYESYATKNSPVQNANSISIQYKKQTKRNKKKSPKPKKRKKNPTPKPCNSIYIHKLNHSSTSRSSEGVKGVLEICEGSYVGLLVRLVLLLLLHESSRFS